MAERDVLKQTSVMFILAKFTRVRAGRRPILAANINRQYASSYGFLFKRPC
jgi:hypothetical protein